MRALTPMCELGVSGSGVGESGSSVGRVSSRAGRPRGRWGGCQKTILSKEEARGRSGRAGLSLPTTRGVLSRAPNNTRRIIMALASAFLGELATVPWVGALITVPWGPGDSGGMVLEPYGTFGGSLAAVNGSLHLNGNDRAYLIENRSEHAWSRIHYQRLKLLGKSLSFVVDVSKAGCGCNAALYLVAMSQPTPTSSNYCDIQQGQSACLEIDLFEGNRKAMQTTLHTQRGTGLGPCNQWVIETKPRDFGPALCPRVL